MSSSILALGRGAVNEYLEEQCANAGIQGIKAKRDKSTKDPTRIAFLPDDRDAVYRPEEVANGVRWSRHDSANAVYIASRKKGATRAEAERTANESISDPVRRRQAEETGETARQAESAEQLLAESIHEATFSASVYEATEVEAAEPFANHLRTRFAWSPGLGWLRRTAGALWERDEGERVVAAVHRLCVGKKNLGKRAASVHAVVRLMRPRMFVPADAWDADPDIACLPDGRVLDLRAGDDREAREGERCTRHLGCAPDAAMPTPAWDAFLAFALGGNKPWTETFLGYCLTGRTTEEVFAFLQGMPGSGKSTLFDTVRRAMGGYAVGVAGENISSSHPTHRQWLARLRGARLALVPEAPPGSWSPEVHELISGGLITANFMRQNSIDFIPQTKLVVTSNTRPSAPPESGIWRRMALVQMDNVPAQPDSELKAKLAAELPGIVAKLAAAARTWYADGLPDPATTCVTGVIIGSTISTFVKRPIIGMEGKKIGWSITTATLAGCAYWADIRD